MSNLKYILLFVLFSLFVSTSCKKKELRDQQKELDLIEGTWNVDEWTVETFDSLGNKISSAKQNSIGTIKFELSQDYSKSSQLAFNTVSFKPEVFSKTYDYLNSKGAGDLVNGIFYCYWEVDPDQKRLLFWGTAPLASYHLRYDMELIKKGKKNRILRFITKERVETYSISKQ